MELFHGSDGDSILNIIREGVMRPDRDNRIYFSAVLEDVFQHGADSKRKAAFGFKARIALPAGASQRREARPGNPIAVIVTSALPVPTEIVELYVRQPRAARYETISGVLAIKAYLLRA